MKIKNVCFNVKTKKREIKSINIPEHTPSQKIEKGINPKKLKQILKNKGIIDDFSEVE